MKKIIILTWAMFSMFGLSPLASAEVLAMPQASDPSTVSETPAAPEPAESNEPAPPAAQSSETVSQSTSVTLPGRGMHMNQVEARFGAPQEKVPAVGQPPITRWVYANYTVYFEYDIVIDSVMHHP